MDRWGRLSKSCVHIVLEEYQALIGICYSPRRLQKRYEFDNYAILALGVLALVAQAAALVI